MDLKIFGQAIRELAEEKGVPEGKVVETIELAVAAAYKKDYGKRGQVIRARFNPATGELHFAQIKLVVDEHMIKSEEEIEAEEAGRTATVETGGKRREPRETDEERDELVAGRRSAGDEAGAGELTLKKVRFNPERHIMRVDAEKLQGGIAVGVELEFPLEPRSEFGRIASQTAKQVIIQRIREAEREATYAEFKDKEGEIVSGIIQRIEGRNVFLDLGRGTGILPFDEQLPRERYAIGERLKALLLLVEKDAKGPGMYLSRSHPRFLKKLFELEVPEIAAGSVEIKAIAREAGSRVKIAAVSHDPAIDPVGSMVGQRGVRVSTVMNEISGEKIDIIEWADEPARFISNALSPAKVLDVALADDRREARVLVPDDQLSLAIGKGGQNVRLAAKLTGWKIDVRSAASEAAAAGPAEEPAGADSQTTLLTAEAAAPVEPAAGTAPEEKPKKKRTAKKKVEDAAGSS